ncbi:snaclec salmorin subunit A-like [Panulirus ornatus]|uniref:snaclec salmorin subunit A-like n=1 Tax=Panulirus ornatus TaxID=150431 RepID=UPI003A8B74CB
MKTTILLTLAAVVACQYPRGNQGGRITFPDSRQPSGPSQPSGQTLGQQLASRPQLNTKRCRYAANNNNYHFSWCNDGGQKYTWSQAINYCQQLGQGWHAVSIESREENSAITKIIARHELPYIWTSGTRQYSKEWQWSATNAPLYYTNWARTGGLGVPQPDNNENNNEQCLGILNHFYPGDTITWHDIGCHHLKPVICEYQGYSG